MASLPQATAAPIPFKQTYASVLLDFIRGLAALLVLAMHWRNLFFHDYSSLPHHNPVLFAFYVLTATGHQAVLIFFVLSGYLIGGSIFRSLSRDRWSWADYLLHRFTRLWIVLIPGLLLGGLWDWIGMHHTAATALYSGHVFNHMVGNVYQAVSTRIFFGNLVFLQTILVPVFGSNGALWSLTNEFWYYILFPLGLLALWKTTRILPRLLYIVLITLLVWKVGPTVLPYFPIWLAGVLLTRMPTLRLGNAARILTAAVYFVIYLAFTRQTFVGEKVGDLLFSTATFVFFWIMLSATTEVKDTALSARFSRTLSSFSYTLYVAHSPLLVLLTAILLGENRWQPTLAHLTLGGGILLLVIAYAWVIAACTELHTHHVVNWIKARTGLR